MNIIVNGQPAAVEDDGVSYEQVVSLARGNFKKPPTVSFSSRNTKGIVEVGEILLMIEPTEFIVFPKI